MSTPNSQLTTSQSPRRVMVYFDGLNLYYGLKEGGWRRHYWLDLRRLARSMLLNGQALVGVKYFTADSIPPPATPINVFVRIRICKRWQRLTACP